MDWPERSAMLPGMAKRPSIAIVGPGKLGTALAEALRDAGFRIEAIVGKPRRQSSKVRRVHGKNSSAARADVVWFCVPDAEIAKAARSMAGTWDWKGKIALHSSGALTSGELDVLRRRGAAVASVHPMMTFVRGSHPSLAEVPFALEGDARAVRVARRIVKDLGGKSYSIRKQDKPAYHAWGTFASPLLTALLATTEKVAALARVKGKAARQRVIPILRQTLANYEAFGGSGGFSGPIVRGDVETVRAHLKVLRAAPAAREVYVALACAALRHLPTKNPAALRRALGLRA